MQLRTYSLVRTSLAFGAQGTAEADFVLEEQDGKTHITWGLNTDFGMNPIGRYMGLFFDGMIGPDYEKGLAKLSETHDKLQAYLAVHDIEPVDRLWEVYVTDPGEVQEADLETHIFVPIAE